MSILDKMHFYALDENFNPIDILDDYDSVIWTERYSDIGDFEIHGTSNPQLIALASTATYLFNSATSSLMVIERPKSGFSQDTGVMLTIQGRSFESFLDRRVMLENRTVFSSDTDIRISQLICALVSEAFSNTYPGRYWGDLVVVNEAPLSSAVLQAGVSMQFTLGENLLDIVTKLCVGYGLGFKCRYIAEDRKMQFIVYEGANRTLQGSDLLVFSDLYDNLLMASDETVFANVKNTVLVLGNKVDPVTSEPILPVLVGDPKWVGLMRRETYFKSDQEATIYVDENTQRPMSNEEYVAALTLAGVTELNSSLYQSYKTFDGEIVETDQCSYGKEFNLGDVVLFNVIQVGSSPARLDGVTFSDDAAKGKTMAPDFTYGV